MASPLQFEPPLQFEHQALVRTLTSADPDAPTLCEGWNTGILAAHLVLRERSLTEMLARAGIPAAASAAEPRLRAFADRNDYRDVVAEFAAGPPWYSPFHLNPLREMLNLLEYLVHHEDVRRGGPEPLPPRELPGTVRDAVTRRLRASARLVMRRTPVTVELHPTGSAPILVGRGDPEVRVGGEPAELVLVAFGRQRAAHVRYDGDPAAVAAFRSATLG
jgi:uncharacterized protein (TIGR03085 family)